MKVSSSMRTTVRRHCFRPRLSPPWPGANSVNAVPGCSADASSGNRGNGGSVAPSPNSPPALGAPVSIDTATASSTGLHDSPAPEGPSPAPSRVPVQLSRPTAVGGRGIHHPLTESVHAVAHTTDTAQPRHKWYRDAPAAPGLLLQPSRLRRAIAMPALADTAEHLWTVPRWLPRPAVQHLIVRSPPWWSPPSVQGQDTIITLVGTLMLTYLYEF